MKKIEEFSLMKKSQSIESKKPPINLRKPFRNLKLKWHWPLSSKLSARDCLGNLEQARIAWLTRLITILYKWNRKLIPMNISSNKRVMKSKDYITQTFNLRESWMTYNTVLEEKTAWPKPKFKTTREWSTMKNNSKRTWCTTKLALTRSNST